MDLKASRIKSFLAAAVLLFAAGTALPEKLADSPSDTSDLKVMSELLESAFDAYVDEDYDRAILHFQRVLQMNPNDKTAKKGLKQSQKMLEAKRQSVQSNEQDKIRLARKYLKKDKWLDAIDQTAAVLLLNPNSRDALEIQNEISGFCRERMSDQKAPIGSDLIYQAVIHYLNKRYDEAIKLWREVATLRPDDFKILVYIERAEQTVQKSEKYDVMVLGRSRAKAFFASGNYDASGKIWDKILKYDPGDAEAKSWLEKIRKESLKFNRENTIGEYYDKGLELFNKGDYAESLKMWNVILEIDPVNEVAKGYADRLRGKLGSPAAAAAPAKAPSVEKPNEPALPGKSGAISRPPGADAPAAPDEANLKEEAQKHYMQGSLNYAEGRLDDAMKEWREAIRIYPAHAPTLKMLKKISGGQKP